MLNLNVDTGVEEFIINGGGVLRFNPGDPNVYHRFFDARTELAALDAALSESTAELGAKPDMSEEARAAAVLGLLAEYDGKIKALLGEIFGACNNFDALLSGVNLAGVGTNGKRVVQNLLEALAPILQAGAQRTVEATAQSAVAAADAARAEREI